MQRIPKVRIDRFAQLDPGDVFVYPRSGGSCLALKALDDEANGEQLILPLGPTYPPSTGGPRLIVPEGFTVISYGKDYTLRLPSATDAWSHRAPAVTRPALGALHRDIVQHGFKAGPMLGLIGRQAKVRLEIGNARVGAVDAFAN